MKRSAVYLNLVLSVALMSAASVAGKLPSGYLESFDHFGDTFEAQQQDATLFADAGTPQLRQQLAIDEYVDQATEEYQHRQGIRSVTYTVVTSERDGNPVKTVNVDMLLSPDSTMAWVTMDNEELPMIHIDYPECFPDPDQTITKQEYLEHVASSLATKATNTWIPLTYERFDVFIDSAYYYSYDNEVLLNSYFNFFEPRYELMETITGWSSEKFHNTKLQIYVQETGACWSGYATQGIAHLELLSNLSNPGACALPYYINGEPYYNNPGELGDNWYFMTGALHESLHSINPESIFWRTWFTEGFSRYNQYNILTAFNDIDQETTDYYIYQGSPNYGWEDYTSNDYKDGFGLEIQGSGGYDITAWMFSMLRDDYNLTWDAFYSLLNNNLETLERSWSVKTGSVYNVDSHILDVFGKALGHTDFETQTAPIFRYDGPSGPGWGVRHLEPLDWYADLVAELPADTALLPGETLPLTIHNNGAVSLENVYTALYANDSLIWSDSLAFADSATTVIDLAHGLPTGAYALTLTVDEDNLKIETDDTNNSDSMSLVIDCCMPPIRGNVDYDPGDAIDISDLVYLVDYMFNSGPEPPCLSESDIDASGGESPIDISDLVYLVDYMFSGGPAPLACP